MHSSLCQLEKPTSSEGNHPQEEQEEGSSIFQASYNHYCRGLQIPFKSPAPDSDYLFSRPKGCLSFLIHLPNIMVLDREDDKATRVFSQ